MWDKPNERDMKAIWEAYLQSAREQLGKKLHPCPRCGTMCSWGYCSETCMLGQPGPVTLLRPRANLARLVTNMGPAATSIKVPMEDPVKLKVRIWACIECGLIWRQPRFNAKHVPSCDECKSLSSTFEVSWYEVILGAKTDLPGAQSVLQELLHERT